MFSEMTFLILIGVSFAAAAAVAVLRVRSAPVLVAVVVAPLVALLAAVAAQASSAIDGLTRIERLEWLPTLGVDFVLGVDALGLLMVALVAGIGVPVMWFSAAYLGAVRLGSFLGLMLAFAAAMIGIVLSDNVFALFVFWEITTVTSYLLIGFNDDQGSARAAALRALLTTGLGGLALLAGLVLLVMETGSTSISEMTAAPPRGTVAAVALGLVLLGAFTKSAQAPFHNWLPAAMAAPTPASTYLHSATMVKAGVFLLVRLWPLFAMSDWRYVVTATGLVTMALGAWRALRQYDLKLLLAYSTISQLGFITALIGLGQTYAAVSVLVAHALFKSALFLTVGTVDHQTKTRDIRVLSGVATRMPVVAAIALLAASSMAGIPPLLGFVTKEAAFDALIGAGDWGPLIVIAAASALTVTYALRFVVGGFGHDEPPIGMDPVGADAPLPSPWLWSAAALPAGVGLLLGVAAGPLGGWVETATGEAGTLVLWPGLKPALALSALVVAAGVVAFAWRRGLSTLQREWADALAAIHTPTGAAYRVTLSGLNRVADTVTGVLQNGSLPVYLGVVLATVVGVTTGVYVAAGGSLEVGLANGAVGTIVLATLIVAAAIATTLARRRMSAALLVGAVGYGVAGLFVLAGAPDLALTQLMFETLTVAAFALVLSRLPRRFIDITWRLGKTLRLLVAGAVGTFVTAAALVVAGDRPSTDVSDYYVENAATLGEGRNVVNVILTDFRALDTLGEITVLAIAAVGVAGLIRTIRRPAAEDRS